MKITSLLLALCLFTSIAAFGQWYDYNTGQYFTGSTPQYQTGDDLYNQQQQQIQQWQRQQQQQEQYFQQQMDRADKMQGAYTCGLMTGNAAAQKRCYESIQ